jgi:hypothetical protein
LTYSTQYAFAWLNAAIGIVAGALAAAYLTIHPSWLDGDVAATAGIVVTIAASLSQILPPLQRTPSVRDARYLAASQGALPKDIAHNYPLLVPAEKVTDKPSGKLFDPYHPPEQP